MNTPRKLDDELERLLADDGGELGALYRRLPRAEPPRRLDRSVLGEAARAVHGRPPRRQRWMVGFGSAAGIVLAAGVAWHVGQDALRQQSNSPAHGAPTYVPVEPLSESAHAKREQAPAPAADAATAPPAVPAPAGAASKADEGQFRHRASRPPATDKELSKQAVPVASPPPAAAKPAAPPAQSAPFPATETMREEPSSAAAAGAVSAQERAAENEHKTAAQALDQAASSSARAVPAPSPSSSVELRRDMQLAPEDWLAHIHQLLQQGRRQQAIESLRLFRNAHPDWRLSDELRKLSD